MRLGGGGGGRRVGQGEGAYQGNKLKKKNKNRRGGEGDRGKNINTEAGLQSPIAYKKRLKHQNTAGPFEEKESRKTTKPRIEEKERVEKETGNAMEKNLMACRDW